MLPEPPKPLREMSKAELVALSMDELLAMMKAAADSVLGMKHVYECMHCSASNEVPARDREEMLVVMCMTCGGLHHLRQGILTKAFEVAAKFDVIADRPAKREITSFGQGMLDDVMAEPPDQPTGGE